MNVIKINITLKNPHSHGIDRYNSASLIIHILSDCIISGNYEDSIRDARAATDLQPTFLIAIKRGKLLAA